MIIRGPGFSVNNCNVLSFAFFSVNITINCKSTFRQRDGIYRVGILEHFLPKSKQTPKPLISKESQDVVCFEKSKHSESNEMGQANLRPQISKNDARSIYSISLLLGHGRCDQIGQFLKKLLAQKFPFKSIPNIEWLLGLFLKTYLFN